MAKLRLLQVQDEQITESASRYIVAALTEAIVSNGVARFAIAGGSATAPLESIRSALGDDWARVKLTWVDERCVRREDPASNCGSAYRNGGLCADHPPAFTLPLWLDDESPEQAIKRVEEGLRSEFDGTLDVALLGMGPDGHIASLFPGHALLHQDSSGASVAYLEDSPKPPAQRVTMTLSFLRNTSCALLLATGESKREALRRVVAGDPSLPASSLSTLNILTNLQLQQQEATT